MAREELITGSMFGGKSEEVIRRLKLPGYKKKRILVVKPAEDNRTTRDIFQMIDEDRYLASYKELKKQTINTFEDFKLAINGHNPQVVVVEETQFLGLWLVDAVKELLDTHDTDDDFIIIISGLYKDFLKNPFGPIPELILKTDLDEITILNAVCHNCEKRPAQSTYKIGGSPHLQKEVGDKQIYQARCRACHKLPE